VLYQELGEAGKGVVDPGINLGGPVLIGHCLIVRAHFLEDPTPHEVCRGPRVSLELNGLVQVVERAVQIALLFPALAT
jgi:hypothetical protein